MPDAVRVDETFTRLLSACGHVCMMVSEEEAEPIAGSDQGVYVLAYDPLAL